MKVFQIEGDWRHENLRLSTRPDPLSGCGEVRLRLRAAARMVTARSRGAAFPSAGCRGTSRCRR